MRYKHVKKELKYLLRDVGVYFKLLFLGNSSQYYRSWVALWLQFSQLLLTLFSQDIEY